MIEQSSAKVNQFDRKFDRQSKLISTSKSNPCPVCGDGGGKCRTFDDKDLVLCMTLESATGWENRGRAKGGLWTNFAPCKESEGARKNWIDYRIDYLHRKAQVEPDEILQTMSLFDRDRFYRDWLRRSVLKPKHQKDLLDRGIEDLSIALSSQFGYALPFKGLDGLYVGAQWRLDEPGDGGRYRWHNLKGGKHYPGTEELPIAVCPVENPKGIVLVEGTGVKPLLAANRLQMVAVGVAGGNYAGAPIQLKAVFERFPNLSVTIAPDAGDLINPHVTRRLGSAIEELQKLKIVPRFLWWGQRTKAENDIDEATPEEISSAKLLTWEEFEELGAPSDRDRQIEQRLSTFLNYWHDLKRDFQLSAALPVTEQEEYEGYCPLLDWAYADTVLVQGWLGAGKTETILRSQKLDPKHQIIIWVCPLNGLNRQTAERARMLGFTPYHYQDNVTMNRDRLERNQPGLYFMCPESFKEYAVGNLDWGNIVVVIDEFQGVRKELANKAERDQIKKAIAQAGRVIVADAFLSNADVALLQKVRPTGAKIYRQKFKKSSVKIKWMETRNSGNDTSFVHEGLYFDLLEDWIKDQPRQRIAIACDSINYAKTIKEFLKTLKFADGDAPRVWLTCSETVDENAIFMPDPDGTIKNYNVDIVIYSPTAKSGLDIQANFDRGLMIATGTLSPIQMLQMLGRCRQCPEWFVSAPRKSANPEVITPSLNGRQVRKWTAQVQKSFEELGFATDDELQGWAVWEDLTKGIEKAFNSEYIYCLLNEYFESVETIEVSSSAFTDWRKTMKRVKWQAAESTLNANLAIGQELLECQRQPANNDQVWDLKLAQVHAKYPVVIDQLRETAAQCDRSSVEYFDAIALIHTFTEERTEKLKNWICAEEANSQDLRDLETYLKERRNLYGSKAHKAYGFYSLYRRLKLAQLALWRGEKLKKENAHEDCYNLDSPLVKELYKQFRGDSELTGIYRNIETIAQFWQLVKSCMSFMGFQSQASKHRMETEEFHKNGKFRGKQRQTKSKVIHFITWLAMDCSGSKFFRNHFDLIIDAIRDRLAQERKAREERRNQYHDPHDPPDFAAA